MPAVQHRRSRAGCHRCRQQHKRCDQHKPACVRCQQAGSACSYALNIQWGGRAFPKMMGSYAGRVQRLSNGGSSGALDMDGRGGFVYIAQPSPPAPAARPRPDRPRRPRRDEPRPTARRTSPPPSAMEDAPACDPNGVTTVSRRPTSVFLAPQIDMPELSPSSLSPLHRFLFHHYMHETIRLTAPSDYARTEICRLVVPMSFRHPCLLYAVLAFGARHVHALGGFPVGVPGDRLIMELEDESMRHLRQQLSDGPHLHQHASVALATTRTLCQSQIFATGHAWRTHLEGARAILQAVGDAQKTAPHTKLSSSSSSSSSSLESELEVFLASWYDNVEAQAALTPLGLRRGQLEMAHTRRNSVRPRTKNSEDVYFDVFGGVASDVPDLIREVGALVMEKRRSMKGGSERRVVDAEHDEKEQDDDQADCILSADDIAREAEALVSAIHVRLQRDAVGNTLRRLQSDDRVARSLPRDAMHDYALSNAGFLHTALLYIHGAVQGLPPTAPCIQHSVQQILWASDNMRSPSAPLSPRVLMATPLFSAGLWALPDAQVAIQRSFAAMGMWMRTPHNRRSAALLAYVWSKTAASPEACHDVLTYLAPFGWLPRNEPEQTRLVLGPRRDDLIGHGHVGGRLPVGVGQHGLELAVDVAQQQLHLGHGQVAAETAAAAVGEGKEAAIHLGIELCVRTQPPLRVKGVRPRKDSLIEAVHRVWLAAHNGAGGQPGAVDLAAAGGDVPRQTHGDGGEDAQPLFEDGMEIGQAVAGLHGLALGQGQLPHQPAEHVAGGLDAGGHVVHALGGHLHAREAERRVLQAGQQREAGGRRAALRLGVAGRTAVAHGRQRRVDGVQHDLLGARDGPLRRKQAEGVGDALERAAVVLEQAAGQAVVKRHLAHNGLVGGVAQGVAAVRVEQVVRHAVKGVAVQRNVRVEHAVGGGCRRALREPRRPRPEALQRVLLDDAGVGVAVRQDAAAAAVRLLVERREHGGRAVLPKQVVELGLVVAAAVGHVDFLERRQRRERDLVGREPHDAAVAPVQAVDIPRALAAELVVLERQGRQHVEARAGHGGTGRHEAPDGREDGGEDRRSEQQGDGDEGHVF
ncbi:hypothetical protein SPBR_04585 [Sporothrix brasiliensis 5110]|uniref:Zn(2)-C6 fungal-type domain-containing protein n=1 Tax=Sporothrix brasiliensis 5110 TaxID=1398154 RepID=A0A0C2IF04_9PEZI|nr:uncharacterized protein SPBR_04585 [Sporothrix brasiliensis 5110]KIH87801.1 hypothetical protein SPBR_04585 [Sporothrix brasiliensis 5110]